MTEKRVHVLKAKAFYELIRERKDDLLIFSFDCQKNQVLPKVPDQSAYYSRQLYEYNFTVVIGDSKMKQTKENVNIYHWNESEYHKGANEIVSAVYHCLTTTFIPEQIKRVRLVADGCGGQNKNMTMIGMISSWFLNNAPKHLNGIELLFPMVGHSYLPADRVFARIEKSVKCKEVIINPKEYVNIFNEYGTTVPLNGLVYNWKNAISDVLKAPGSWHFQFQPSKRIFFKRSKSERSILVQGECNYRNCFGTLNTLTKRGKFLKNLNPEKINAGVTVNELKIRDVNNLLTKHFGTDWKTFSELSFYAPIMEVNLQNNENIDEERCERAVESHVVV